LNEIIEANPNELSLTEEKDRMERGIKLGKMLKDVIVKEKLFHNIQGKNYVLVEGWQTLNMLLGLHPRVTMMTEHQGEFVAHVDMLNRENEVVSTAFASCGDEQDRPWNKRSRAARRSMAQTRAIAKAGRMMFGHIVKLAGYEATPAEEMPSEETKKSKLEVVVQNPPDTQPGND
tara:strand:+ start:581 stop:1105 length:525 start_codon:yes stop_codon:yes gene_type:complete